MSNDYSIAFDSSDNLCVLEKSTNKYYYKSWSTIVADATYSSFTSDNSISHNMISQAGSDNYYVYSNIGTAGDIQLQFTTNLGNITLPVVLLANLLDLYVADASLSSNVKRVAELQRRIQFVNQAK